MIGIMIEQIDWLDKENIDVVRQAVRQQPDCSCKELARKVCKTLDWRQKNGDLKEGKCREWLDMLAQEDIIELPTGRFSQRSPAIPLSDLPEGCAEFEGELADLGDIYLEKVGGCGSESFEVWKEMMEAAHPVGGGKLYGRQMRYLARSSEEGIIGGFAFSSPAFKLKARSKYIGWTVEARELRRDHIVQNSRFLILPGVRVPNLASKLLSIAEKRVVEDWAEQYDQAVYMLETFVHPDAHSGGSCYSAAGWEKVGITAGRGRQDRENKAEKDKKLIFLKSTAPDWQGKLCRMACGRIKILDEPEHQEPDSWVEQELGAIDLGDERLDRRARRIVELRYRKPHAPYPASFIEDADLKATYRFLRNEKTSMDKILDPHSEQTIKRADDYEVVLAAQDTTSLNYSNLHVMEGMGMINNTENGAQGLELHSTLAVTEAGVPLGFLAAECWSRPEEPKDWTDIKNVPIQQKESFKWIKSYRQATRAQRKLSDTRVISVGDRGSDIYDLFLEAKHTEGGAGLLVRSSKSRQRCTQMKDLWEHMREMEPQTQMDIEIPNREDADARETTLDVTYKKVTLDPPKTTKHTESVQMWVVYACEQEGVADEEERLEWLLLTTEPTETNEQACQRIEQYHRRWSVEVYHKILKSGCNMEDRQMQTADRITTCLALDMLVAWRVFYMTMLAREMPGRPCTAVLTEMEWKATVSYLKKPDKEPQEPPTLDEMIALIAKLGGHQKKNGAPGPETMWRGLQRVSDLAGMLQVTENW
ncbi:MAG: IS4 family transposase [Planctomycetota bacterium]